MLDILIVKNTTLEFDNYFFFLTVPVKIWYTMERLRKEIRL